MCVCAREREQAREGNGEGLGVVVVVKFGMARQVKLMNGSDRQVDPHNLKLTSIPLHFKS